MAFKKLGLDNASALYPFLLELAIHGTPIRHYWDVYG